MKRPTQVLHRQGHSTVCTVPTRLLDALQWKLGTEVYVEEIAGCVVIMSIDQLVTDRLATIARTISARKVEPIPA